MIFRSRPRPLDEQLAQARERLTEVTCTGWGDDDPQLKGNPYSNPFWNETAHFRTNRGNAMQVQVWWRGAHRGVRSRLGLVQRGRMVRRRVILARDREIAPTGHCSLVTVH